MSRKKELQLLGDVRIAHIRNMELRQIIKKQSLQVVSMRERELKHGKILLIFAALLTLSLITNFYLIFR